MVFTHDTEVALQGAVALVNSAEEPDTLTTREQLADFVTTWQWTGRRDGSAAELAAVRALRPRLRRLWSVPEEELVAGVNELLREGRALPQLVRHDGWDWHLHATTPQEPLATRMAVEAAMAMVDLIRAGETSRMAVCAAPDCDAVLVDLSRNRSRLYCDSGCTNRMAAAAYRARQG